MVASKSFATPLGVVSGQQPVCSGAMCIASTVGLRHVVQLAQDVEPYVVVAGNPARVIRRLERPPDGQ